MDSPMTAREPARCVAPVGPEVATWEEERLCGAPATTTRIVGGLECPLCAEHAAEIDRDREIAAAN